MIACSVVTVVTAVFGGNGRDSAFGGNGCDSCVRW